jgi:hypothetical protein
MDRLAELSERYPDMRFGQLVLMVAYSAKSPVKSAAYDVEDDQFLDAINKLLSEAGTVAGAISG